MTICQQQQQQEHQHSPIKALPRATFLSREEISRYSRQLLMPQIGMRGQLAIKSTSVLIVGAGGLGAPAAMYLAAAGIGRIGIVDYDAVESNNLHRQIIHNELRVGMNKVDSAKITLQQYFLRIVLCTFTHSTPLSPLDRLNPWVEVIPYHTLLTRENAMAIAEPYDVILDASDNAATRYLINDVAVLLDRPLVSGSALRVEGQLSVYHFQGGPCYRCLFPRPPDPSTVTNCGDGGVLGAVPGLIGTMQAMEAIKIALLLQGVHASGVAAASTNATTTSFDCDVLSQRMLLLDGFTSQFRTVKLRGRRKECAVCGDSPTIDRRALVDYEQFCGQPACDKTQSKVLLSRDKRLTCVEYKEQVVQTEQDHVLLDVRQRLQFDICALPNARNVPLEELPKHLQDPQNLRDYQQRPVYVICRRGNRSQDAVQLMGETFGLHHVKDIIGGVTAWSRDVDPEFPVY